MKSILWTLLIFVSNQVQSQQQDVDQIKACREASNEAIRAFDNTLNATFSTPDAFITTGAGTLIAGNEELKAYLQVQQDSKMYWIRTPSEIIVNANTWLAWEIGTWEGYTSDANTSITSGKYAAQWTKASGIWLIHSQLFVTLE